MRQFPPDMHVILIVVAAVYHNIFIMLWCFSIGGIVRNLGYNEERV